jgi:hypothetical protein
MQTAKKDNGIASERKEYSPPRILHTEKIETRAVVCARADGDICSAGPLES